MGASQVEETNAQSQKLYTCEHCQMTFLRPVHLERHMRNVHSQEQESECKVCHKLFQNKYYLSVHMLTHAMDKELDCPLCKKRFPDLDSLNKHKDAHLGLGMNHPANKNNPYPPGTNPQPNNQSGARNLVNPAASTAGAVPTTSTYTGANRGNTLNCDLRLTDLNSLNRGPRNYRSAGQPAVQNTMRMPANKNSTVSCDLRLGDINSLNRNATGSMRLPQKRPSSDDHDVIVTGISSLKRPFRVQGHSGANPSRNPASPYATPRLANANKPPSTSHAQLSSRNSFLQNQLRAQNSLAAQRSSINNSMTNRNVTDRIYLTSEGGVSSQSTVRNSLPARISYSNRKQLANHLTQNNRFGNNSIYSNLSNQRNQLLRNSNQANQRSVVNCDLTRSNLGTVNRHTGLPYNNAGQQFSNGTKETDSTVNCDLTISNISSLSKNQWPTNSNNSNSHSAPVRNYGLSTRPVSTVNFDLTTADINVLKRNRRLRQAGRLLGPSASTVGQGSSTLNCDLSVANLATMEKNRHALSNGNRFGRLNPNMIASQNSQQQRQGQNSQQQQQQHQSQNPQQAQNTVNCDLTTNNLNDWNRRNTICYRANNQTMLGQNRQPTRTLNCNLTNVNLSSLNQRVANNIGGAQSNQPQVRPVQVYANSAALQRQKNAVALSNSNNNNNNNFGVRGPNNVLRGRTLPRRTAGVGPPVSALSSINRSRMSRMFRQRKMLASSNVPVIDLDPDVSVVSKSTTRPTNSSNIVQFDLTGPDVNVTTYENGGSSISGKKSSGNLVDIVELGTNKNTRSQPVSNNASSVVEFDLSNTNIQSFSTGQNDRANTCTINLDGDNWTSNPRDNNASSDVTLLEVRTLIKPAEGASQNVPEMTLSNVRSLSTLQSAEDERMAVSGITLVDIRSLSTSEIDANFQNDSEKSQNKTSSDQSVPDISSSANSRSTDDLPKPTVVMDTATVGNDNAEANVVTESAGTSENDAGDKVELKEDYFTCKTCLEQIHHLCNYISHLKSHNSKEFCKCYYCDSVFGNIQELVVHSVVHVGDLKKQCVFCREVLASGEDPITHMTGCGEFQCIMFESGSRVKIENPDQKEGEEAESVAPDENAKSAGQDAKAESLAQDQVKSGERDQSEDIMRGKTEDGISVEKGKSEETKDDEEAKKTKDEITKDNSGVSLDEKEVGDIEGESTDKDESEKANEKEDKSLAASQSLEEEAEKAGEAETVGKETAKTEKEKMELKYQSNAKDDNDQPVDETNLKLADRNEKGVSEENKTEDNVEESREEMEQENSAKTGLQSSGPPEDENADSMDSNKTEPMEETDTKVDSPTTWCEWEKDIVIKSKRRGRVAKKDDKRRKKKIEFEVNVNKLKRDKRFKGNIRKGE